MPRNDDIKINADHAEFIEDGITGDSIEFAVSGGRLSIRLDNPWAGDSERGFGETTHIDLTRKQAEQLTAWLAGKFGAKPDCAPQSPAGPPSKAEAP